MSGKIIVFDGLDCSFKETNTKAYLKYLQDKGQKAALFSFPRYGKEQSVFVKEYLAGSYGDKSIVDPVVISSFYMYDMMDCMKREAEPLLKEGYTIILDRYWYCNLFYRLGSIRLLNRDKTEKEANIVSLIERLAIDLRLPKADIIIKLISDKDVMLDFVHHKNSKKDQHESDDKFLESVASVFKNINLSKYAYDKVLEIYTTKNGKIRSKEDILDDIVRGIES